MCSNDLNMQVYCAGTWLNWTKLSRQYSIVSTSAVAITGFQDRVQATPPVTSWKISRCPAGIFSILGQNLLRIRPLENFHWLLVALFVNLPMALPNRAVARATCPQYWWRKNRWISWWTGTSSIGKWYDNWGWEPKGVGHTWQWHYEFLVEVAVQLFSRKSPCRIWLETFAMVLLSTDKRICNK